MAETITDAGGRKLELRKLNALDQVRMLRAIGAEQAQNQPYVHMVECAFMVAAIDGVPMPLPTSERTIDGAISRLGDDGMSAVMVQRIKEINAANTAADAAAEGGNAADPLEPSAS